MVLSRGDCARGGDTAPALDANTEGDVTFHEKALREDVAQA